MSWCSAEWRCWQVDPCSLLTRRSVVHIVSVKLTECWSIGSWLATLSRNESRRSPNARWCWLTWWCGRDSATRELWCPNRSSTTFWSLVQKNCSRTRKTKKVWRVFTLCFSFILQWEVEVQRKQKLLCKIEESWWLMFEDGCLSLLWVVAESH